MGGLKVQSFKGLKVQGFKGLNVFGLHMGVGREGKGGECTKVRMRGKSGMRRGMKKGQMRGGREKGQGKLKLRVGVTKHLKCQTLETRNSMVQGLGVRALGSGFKVQDVGVWFRVQRL